MGEGLSAPIDWTRPLGPSALGLDHLKATGLEKADAPANPAGASVAFRRCV